MKIEKIVKRDDGSKAKIVVSFKTMPYSKNIEYEVSMFTCEKGKRTWIRSFSTDDYMYRRLDAEGRKAFELKTISNQGLDDEVYQTKLELWELSKPVK